MVEKEIILKLRDLGVSNAWEVMLYSKILSMSSNSGYCTASNRYFANLLGVKPRSVQRYLAELSKLKIIKTYEQKVGSHTESRKIYPQVWKDADVEEVEENQEDTGVVEDQTSGAVQKKEKIVPEDPEREKKREENLKYFRSLEYGGIMSNDLIPEVCEAQYARAKEEYEDETMDETRERLMKFLTGGFVLAKKELAEELVDTVIAGNGRL